MLQMEKEIWHIKNKTFIDIIIGTLGMIKVIGTLFMIKILETLGMIKIIGTLGMIK